MTETLAAALSHFEEFELIDPGGASGVIAAVGAIEAGQQLGVTYVLEGSLQLAPGKARIGVQLIDAESGQRSGPRHSTTVSTMSSHCKTILLP